MEVERLSFKEIMLVSPFLGTALALSFGYGFFSAVGVNFIMLFSLSEHIIAAIPAYPIAFFVAFGVVGAVYANRAIWITQKKGLEKVRSGKLNVWWIFLIGAVAVGLVIAESIIGWTILKRVPRNTVVLATSMTILVLGIAVLFTYYTSSPPFFVFATCVVVSLMFAYAVGKFLGTEIIESKSAPYEIVVGQSTYVGTLLYGGEKGVLFYVPSTKRTIYLRTESIKLLSREIPGS